MTDARKPQRRPLERPLADPRRKVTIAELARVAGVLLSRRLSAALGSPVGVCPDTLQPAAAPDMSASHAGRFLYVTS
jgi:hypothetical protein